MAQIHRVSKNIVEKNLDRQNNLDKHSQNKLISACHYSKQSFINSYSVFDDDILHL